MTRTMSFAAIVLPLAGILCAHFVPIQDLNWAVLGLTAAAVAFAFVDMYLAKKHHA
jgi:hypothetical protein